MAAMAETSGPFSRAAALCHKLIERGHEVALCAAEDVNYRSIENVKNYYAPIPSPLGMPMFVGAINKKHFYEDVHYIRKAIQDFKPDIVYAEFRISAIVSAKLEKVKVVTGYSYPVQKSFASNPEYSTGVREFLKENGMPSVESVLDIFNWAGLKVVPSSYDLEPIEDKNIVFTGPFLAPNIKTVNTKRNKIIAYVGNGTITPKRLISNLSKAFEQTDFEVYIATGQVTPCKKNNIIVDKKFDFSKLMPEAITYINHGGQNSIMTGLMYGVPQIMCPGNVFERRYNAASIVNLGAGVSLESNNFNYEEIKKIVDDFRKNPIYESNSKSAGEKLLSLGGVNKVVDEIEHLIL
jgi:uncharacterized protein (TIGR00661 family)